jgi:C4-dicarboxylate transporter, DctM subunit
MPTVGFHVDVVPLETIVRGVGWFLACEVVIMVLILSFSALWLPNSMD